MLWQRQEALVLCIVHSILHLLMPHRHFYEDGRHGFWSCEGLQGLPLQ